MIDVAETRTPLEAETDWPLLLSEHAELAAWAEQVEDVLESLVEGEAAASDGSSAKPLLAGFRRRLAAHLESEEQSGVLERACAAEPRYDRRLAGLRREHGELRARMEALVAESARPRASWLRIHDAFVAFRRDLQAHERAENEVLQSVYLDDIGVGD